MPLEHHDPSVAARQLAQNLSTLGGSVLRNTSIDRAPIREAQAAAESLFLQPETELDLYRHPMRVQRGYARIGNQGGQQRGVQSFHIGRDSIEVRLLHGGWEPNIWPVDPPSFRPSIESLHVQLCSLAEQLLGEIDAAFDLRGSLIEMTRSGDWVLRPTRFDAQLNDGKVGDRVPVHTDVNVITLLPQGGTPGLLLQARDGNWWTPEWRDGDFLLLAGLTLERCTGGAVWAPPHRSRTTGLASGAVVTLPFFVFPDPLVPVRSGAQSSTDESILARDVVAEGLRRLGQ